MATRREEVDDKLKGAIQRESRVQNAPAFTSGTSQGPLVNQTTLQALNTVSNFTTGAAKNYISTKNNEALLRGQIAARQGQSLESLKLEEGANKYALEGWRVMSANNTMSALLGELKSELQQKDYEMSPEDYAAYLSTKINKLSEDEYGYPIDPRLSQMMTEGMNKVLPGLIESHIQLNVAYNTGKTSEAHVASLGQGLGIGPLNKDSTSTALNNINIATSGLSKKQRTANKVEAINQNLLSDDVHLYQNLKKHNLLKDLSAEQLQQVNSSYRATQQRRYNDMSVEWKTKEREIKASINLAGSTKVAADVAKELEEHYAEVYLDTTFIDEAALVEASEAEDANRDALGNSAVTNLILSGNPTGVSEFVLKNQFPSYKPEDAGKLDDILLGNSDYNVKLETAGPASESGNKDAFLAIIASSKYTADAFNSWLEAGKPEGEIPDYINTIYNEATGFIRPTTTQMNEVFTAENASIMEKNTREASATFTVISKSANQRLVETGDVSAFKATMSNALQISYLDKTAEVLSYTGNALVALRKQQFNDDKAEKILAAETQIKAIGAKYKAQYELLSKDGNILSEDQLTALGNSQMAEVDSIISAIGLHPMHYNKIKLTSAAYLQAADAEIIAKSRQAMLSIEQNSLETKGVLTGDAEGKIILDKAWNKAADIKGVNAAVSEFKGYIPDTADRSKSFMALLTSENPVNPDPIRLAEVQSQFNDFVELRKNNHALSDALYKDPNARIHMIAIANYQQSTGASFEQAYQNVIVNWKAHTPEELAATEARADNAFAKALSNKSYQGALGKAKDIVLKSFDVAISGTTDLTYNFTPKGISIGTIESLQDSTVDATLGFVISNPGASDKQVSAFVDDYLSVQTAKVGDSIITNKGVEGNTLLQNFFGTNISRFSTTDHIEKAIISYVANKALDGDLLTDIVPDIKVFSPEARLKDPRFKVFADSVELLEFFPGNLGKKGTDSFGDFLDQHISKEGLRKINAVYDSTNNVITIQTNPAYEVPGVASISIPIDAREIGNFYAVAEKSGIVKRLEMRSNASDYIRPEQPVGF